MGIKTKTEFKALFDDHYNPLCNYAYSILQDHSLAEDAVQDVFIKLWKKRDKIELDANFLAYLFVSVRNKALEIIRKQKKEQNKLSKMPPKPKEVAETDINKEIDKYLLKEKLNNSIRQLPPKCREIFVLSKIDGLTYDEIAELRNISKKTVENHIANAFKILRKILRE